MVTAKHIMRGNGVAGISVRVGFRCFRDVAKAARKLPVRQTKQSYTKVITVSPRPRFFLLYTRNTIEREGTKVANSAGLKIQFRRDSWVRLPSLAFPPQGQISSSIENSLRCFKNSSTAESDVFSGTGSGAPTPEPVQFHHIKPEYATRSLEKARKKGQITEDDRTLIQKCSVASGLNENIIIVTYQC